MHGYVLKKPKAVRRALPKELFNPPEVNKSVTIPEGDM